MKKLHCFDKDSLQKSAHHLISQGFSVIPVHGDSYSENPKKPATNWKAFQKRLASPAEINDWFKQKITAIGIVCGQVSRLMVIDFDDEFTYRKFVSKFPQYSDTYTIRTRRGYHLYFEVDQHISTFKFDGGDIKGEKSYVVTAPSVVNGYMYYVIKSDAHTLLRPSDIDIIFNNLHVNELTKTPKSTRHTDISPSKLLTIYDTLMPQIGRNNALYRVASIANSRGVSLNQAEDILIRHHINQPAPLNHQQETSDERFIEATRTIGSAYSHNIVSYKTSAGLPNSVRECLLQLQHSTIVPRILDIMRLTGWKRDQYFSMPQLINIAKRYGINRKSVMSALTGDLSVVNGEFIIYREYVEYPDIYGLNDLRGGRPVEFMYRVPSTERLLELLNVKWSPSDLVLGEDVKTAHAYRLALHREYIKRNAPEVPMWWLAERLGVNVRTIQRFNHELDVQKMQNFGFFTLSKSNLDTLPKRTQKTSKNATNGFWLEVDDGTQYPAWRHIGSHLLKTQKKDVKVVMQRPSKLSLNPQAEAQNDVKWTAMQPDQFLKILMFRACGTERPTLKSAVDNLYQYVKQRVNRVRYDKLQLHFDSVISHIAKDSVAETITSYLYAYDANGDVVRRPARRGIAYRMLKEFGNGNVYLALLDLHTEIAFSLARHALRFGYVPTAMKLLLSALD